jgi:hypothetical protein
MDALCIICSKKTSYAGKPKHLFSSAHDRDFSNAVLRNKDKFKAWLQDVKVGIPSIMLKNKAYKVCFTCKKVALSTDFFRGCPTCDGVENAKVIKGIIETKVIVEIPGSQKADVVPEVLQKEVDKLKRKVEQDAPFVAQAMELSDALTAVLSMLQEDEKKLGFNKALEVLKEYPQVYKSQLRDLGL